MEAFAKFTINVPAGVPGNQTLSKGIIPGVIQLLLLVAFVLALVFLILGGISWVSSGGSKEGLENARKKVTYSIIGLIIILLSFFLVYTIGGMFGLNLKVIPLP